MRRVGLFLQKILPGTLLCRSLPLCASIKCARTSVWGAGQQMLAQCLDGSMIDADSPNLPGLLRDFGGAVEGSGRNTGGIVICS